MMTMHCSTESPDQKRMHGDPLFNSLRASPYSHRPTVLATMSSLKMAHACYFERIAVSSLPSSSSVFLFHSCTALPAPSLLLDPPSSLLLAQPPSSPSSSSFEAAPKLFPRRLARRATVGRMQASTCGAYPCGPLLRKNRGDSDFERFPRQNEPLWELVYAPSSSGPAGAWSACDCR